MKITDLVITGVDDAAMLFVMTLTADDASIVKPGTDEAGEAIVGKAGEKARDAFTAIRDRMNDILGTHASASPDSDIAN